MMHLSKASKGDPVPKRAF